MTIINLTYRYKPEEIPAKLDVSVHMLEEKSYPNFSGACCSVLSPTLYLILNRMGKGKGLMRAPHWICTEPST